MKPIRLVGEDALCCALGTVLVRETMPGWYLRDEPTKAGGITKLLPALGRYSVQARHVMPVLCIADTDSRCPVELRAANLPVECPEGLLLRFAVPEAECWVLADAVAVADHFRIATNLLSAEPERLDDPKQEVLRLAKRSKVRRIREEMVIGTNPLRPGVGYNLHLTRLVQEVWSSTRAATNSPSLRRTVARLRAFAESHL